MTASSAGRAALGKRRQQVIDLLTEHFSRDELDVDEFEERVGEAHRAGDVASLNALIADLTGCDEPGEASVALAGEGGQPNEETALAPVRPAMKSVVAVLGNSVREGSWRAPERLRSITVLGDTTLDFREVALPAGVTEVRLYCVLGEARVIVPPELSVECEGIGILGDVKTVERAPPVPDESRPQLRVTGVAVLGDVDVEMRLPGESKRDAKRRRKRKLREAKRRRPELGS